MIRRSRPAQDSGGSGGNTPPPLSAQHGQPVDPDATRILQPQVGGAPIPASSEVDDDATRLIHQPSQPLSNSPTSGDDSDKTQLVRRSSSLKGAGDAVSDPSAASGPGTSMDDPVVGWLVIVSGPGKGSHVAVGEQDNHVGRGGGSESPRVQLDFGDRGISRSNAFVIRYDPKKRRFKILPGKGSNIIYLNDDDLDHPTEIKSGDVIEVSETKLRFVSFCGGDFDWADCDESGGGE